MPQVNAPTGVRETPPVRTNPPQQNRDAGAARGTQQANDNQSPDKTEPAQNNPAPAKGNNIDIVA